MTQFLKQSTAVDVLIGPFLDLSDGVTEEVGESPAVVLSKGGQALAAKNDATTPAHDASGYHNCELDATDTNTVGTLALVVANTAGARGIRHEYEVVEEAIYDAMYGASAAGFDANGRVDVGAFLGTAVAAATASGEVASNVTEWLGSAVSAVNAGQPNVNTRWINASLEAAITLGTWLNEGTSGIADSGTTTTMVDAGLTQADDFWNGCLIVFQFANLGGRTAIVTDFDAATDTITFAPAMPQAVTTENFILMPGLGWADIVALHGDGPAAINLESQYDGTGLTGDTFPATQSGLGSIGSGGGGALPFAAEIDNAIRDTIDNAPAVDKGSGLVGIPITGHAFTAGFEVTIASTTNYNGSFKVISQTTNEIVITDTFVSETFGGSETCLSSIKGVTSVGTLTSGTFASTEALDGVLQVLTNAGDNLDWAFSFPVGGGRTGTEVDLTCYLTGNNDTVNVQAYDFIGDVWDTRTVLQGTAQATLQGTAFRLLGKHTGTAGDFIGKVLIRFVDATAAGHVLGIDEMVVEAVNIGQTAGYSNGRIYVKTIGGQAGTEPFVNGTADNPVLTWADALTLSANPKVGLTDFHIVNGSTIQLSANSDNFSLFGDNWTLDMNGQSTAKAHFQGAIVNGIQTGTGASFSQGEVGSVTLANDAHMDNCGLAVGTITLAAGEYHLDRCHHGAATPPVLNFGAAIGNTTVHMHAYGGGIQIQNMGDSGTDIMHLDGDGKLVLDGSGSGGTINVRGKWEVTGRSAFEAAGGTLVLDDDAVIVGAVKAVTDLLTTAQTEPGQGAPAVNETPLTKLAYLFKGWRNRSNQTSDTYQLFGDDALTVDQKAIVSDDTVTAEKGEVISGP